MSSQGKAYLYAAATVLFWSTAASAFKLSLRRLDFLQLLLFSSATSTLVLFVILAARGKLSLLASFSKADYARSALLGFLNPFLYYVVLFKAYSLLPARQAQPLNYTWPIMLVLLSVLLLGRKIGVKSIAAMCVSFFGVLIISTEGNIASFGVSSPLGVGLAMGSSVVWALYWIYNIKDGRDPVARLFLNFCFGFVFVLAATAVFSDLRPPGAAGLAGAAYVGLFEMGLTFVAWITALKLSANTARVSILVYLSPFLSLIFIHFVVGEDIPPSTIAGLVLIVAGIVVGQWKRAPASST
ncbi:MAG: DMT family transporter [Pseudomonadota bacterium]